MRIDIGVGSPDPRDAGRIARLAEEAGFDGVWAAETTHDPFVLSALMLAATERLEVGTSVAIAFARSPVTIAHSAWDLATLGNGRFLLGLGTQVRGHIERRFGMAWSAPAPRLEEWIGAVRAAWRTWSSGEPFRFRSEHLDLSLMPTFFSPSPLPFDAPAGAAAPISVAGVGPGLARLAGRAADGFQVHPFHTARYLAEVLEPAIEQGLAERAAPGAPFERVVPLFVVPAEDAALRDEVRRQVAFYAATPTYRAVLALHGRERAGERLTRLAATGRWDEMAVLIDDDLLREVAVVAPREELRDAIRARVRGRAERLMLLVPFPAGGDGPAGEWLSRLVAALR